MSIRVVVAVVVVHRPATQQRDEAAHSHGNCPGDGARARSAIPPRTAIDLPSDREGPEVKVKETVRPSDNQMMLIR
jgi:hypothetical protein